MKKFLQKRLGNEKGLTLVELLAVIVILGIIAAIAIPSIGNVVQSSREKAVIVDAQNVLAAGNLYFLENTDKTSATLSSGAGDSLIPVYVDNQGTLSSATVNKTSNGATTISFTGSAGNKTITVTNASKTDLSNKEIYKEFK
ncbi:prepilin-type N-terminal cleavage/methylation domain-containing protein [Sporosarcina sp. JAI121]|uniref:prepilin-type N-terminal cleavage/methylation domain-containing protein n=1 Tax=Sporosarcina sp. JAI121 TaxID=2723064 RepID=UPI0015C8A92B|nr:prepilin-type N-terminal cleavage/methylation domain-containing protein [Sporosarcina sp. JAI121]NYF25019.1 type IV pilus assembly protein PilA [Sporosarcina sp. JAI121]